jgi:hypothetical protein
MKDYERDERGLNISRPLCYYYLPFPILSCSFSFSSVCINISYYMIIIVFANATQIQNDFFLCIDDFINPNIFIFEKKQIYRANTNTSLISILEII